jgi:hypothetical protein
MSERWEESQSPEEEKMDDISLNVHPTSPYVTEVTQDEDICKSTNEFYNWVSRWGEGIIHDVMRRKQFYISDWTDGYHRKLLSAICFLFFANLLPTIAFGVLNESHTDGMYMYVYVYIFMYLCIYVCMCLYMHIHICLYIYTYICIYYSFQCTQ